MACVNLLQRQREPDIPAGYGRSVCAVDHAKDVTYPSMAEIMEHMQAFQTQADVRHAQKAAEQTVALNALQADITALQLQRIAEAEPLKEGALANKGVSQSGEIPGSPTSIVDFSEQSTIGQGVMLFKPGSDHDDKIAISASAPNAQPNMLAAHSPKIKSLPTYVPATVDMSANDNVPRDVISSATGKAPASENSQMGENNLRIEKLKLDRNKASNGATAQYNICNGVNESYQMGEHDINAHADPATKPEPTALTTDNGCDDVRLNYFF